MARERSGEAAHDPTADRHDPRCPSCGEKVGARATHCIHCWADLPDRAEYDDDVTGGTTEVSHSTDEVTGGTHEMSRESDAGGTILTILRSVARGKRGKRARELEDRRGGTRGSDRTRRRREPASESGRERGRRDTDRPSVPTGQGADGPSLLPGTVLDDPRRAGKFLGGLAVLGAAALVGLDRSLVVTGVLLAAVAWGGSVVSLARRRGGFDAMRYGSYGLLVTLVFGSFALAYAAEGGLVPFLLALVPVAVSALLVGGFGHSAAEHTPG